jgi:hypothetical protein
MKRQKTSGNTYVVGDIIASNVICETALVVDGLTLVDTTSTQTLTNKTLTDPTISTFNGSKVPVDTTSTQTLTNKTLTNPTISAFNGNKEPVDTTSTQTLINKTLISPLVTGTELFLSSDVVYVNDVVSYDNTGLRLHSDWMRTTMTASSLTLANDSISVIKWTTGGNLITDHAYASVNVTYNNSTGGFTIVQAGLYYVQWSLSTATSQLTSFQSWVTKSTNSLSTSYLRYGAGGGATNKSGQYSILSGSALIDCADGDTLAVHAYQNSGSTITLSPRNADVLCYITIVKVSAP